MNRLSPIVVLIYAITSVITFIFYWLDKRAAKNNTQRTPEATLQSLSLIGGWPGALLAQRIFRHKTSKKLFRIIFWIQVFLNIIGLLNFHINNNQYDYWFRIKSATPYNCSANFFISESSKSS